MRCFCLLALWLGSLPAALGMSDICTPLFAEISFTKISLRALRPEDGPRLKEIFRQKEMRRDRLDDEIIDSMVQPAQGPSTPNADLLDFAVVEQGTGRLVGIVSIGKNQNETGVAEISYWLDPAAWNKGYATEAVGSLVNAAFAKLGVKKIRVRVRADNIGSSRVAEKLGFTLTKKLRVPASGAKDEDWFVYERTR